MWLHIFIALFECFPLFIYFYWFLGLSRPFYFILFFIYDSQKKKEVCHLSLFTRMVLYVMRMRILNSYLLVSSLQSVCVRKMNWCDIYISYNGPQPCFFPAWKALRFWSKTGWILRFVDNGCFGYALEWLLCFRVPEPEYAVDQGAILDTKLDYLTNSWKELLDLLRFF